MPTLDLPPRQWTLLTPADWTSGRFQNDPDSATSIDLQGTVGAVVPTDPPPSPITLVPGEGVLGTLAEHWGSGTTRVYARPRHIGAKINFVQT